MSGLILNIKDNIYVNKETKRLVNNNVEPFKDITDIFKDDNNLFKIEINGYEIIKPIEWFIIYATYKPDYILNIDLNNLDFKDYKPYGVSLDIDIMPIFIKPIYYTYNGIKYRLLSRYPGYAVDENGNTINIVSNKLSSFSFMGSIPKRKYKFSTLNDRYKNDKTKSVFIHRLVAIAWCPNDNYITKNIVDHIDDNSLNNNYKNLAWVSNRKNIAKAVWQTNDNIVLLRNIDTEEVTEHISTNEAYKYIGRSQGDSNGTPFYYGRIFIGTNGRFEMKLKKHLYGWKYINGFKPEDLYLWTIEYNGTTRCFKRTYDAKVAFRDIIGRPVKINNDEFKKALSKIGAKYTYTNDSQPINYVGVKDIKEDKTFETNSIKEASRLLRVSRYVIERELKLIKLKNMPTGRLINNRFLLKPERDMSWPDIGTYKFKINKPKVVIMEDIDNGKIIKFNSIRRISAYINKNQRTIVYYIKNNIPYVNEETNKTYKLYFE